MVPGGQEAADGVLVRQVQGVTETFDPGDHLRRGGVAIERLWKRWDMDLPP
jgi:hypothetical protein